MLRRLFKRGFCRHGTASCVVLDPKEARYFAGPAAIIMVESRMVVRERKCLHSVLIPLPLFLHDRSTVLSSEIEALQPSIPTLCP